MIVAEDGGKSCLGIENPAGKGDSEYFGEETVLQEMG